MRGGRDGGGGEADGNQTNIQEAVAAVKNGNYDELESLDRSFPSRNLILTFVSHFGDFILFLFGINIF